MACSTATSSSTAASPNAAASRRSTCAAASPASLPAIATDAENALLARLRRILTTYENAALMIQTGLYVQGSDPGIDEAIRLWPKLDAFFTERSPEGVAASFSRLTKALE